MSRIAFGLTAAGLAAALVTAGPANAGPVVPVLTDLSGDAGANATAAPAVGDTGVDIVKGTIARAGGDLVFAVSMASMPAQGSFPEGARLIYHFNVDAVEWRMTVKSVDIGKPDALAQSGTERVGKIDQTGHFRLEQCALDMTLPVGLSQCKPVTYLKGKVDVVTKTISWQLPLAIIKAKPGNKIKPGTGAATGTGCEVCWVGHFAERSLTPSMVMDNANVSKDYVIPKK